MINTKCNNIHKYSPFKKDNNSFYRVCLKCNKKTIYPNDKEIENEYNNQRIINYIIDTIIKRKINNIQNTNYFYRIITHLIDNISYLYLTTLEQEKLFNSLSELNNYFNNQDQNKYILINEAKEYIHNYFNNYNNEINNIINDKTLDILDKEYLILTNKLNIELESIITNEENTLVTIDNSFNDKTNFINVSLNEAENETE